MLDYLLEEVLQRQSDTVQSFLLGTSILDQMCGPLCDAVVLDATVSGQATLEYLERANLFLVPLDNERRWYRYHHLFADLLLEPCSSVGAYSNVDQHFRSRLLRRGYLPFMCPINVENAVAKHASS